MSLKVNLHTWFSIRELSTCPKHFIIANTRLTPESYLWILENLTGRFSLILIKDKEDIWAEEKFPAFEDASEAVYYELEWS